MVGRGEGRTVMGGRAGAVRCLPSRLRPPIASTSRKRQAARPAPFVAEGRPGGLCRRNDRAAAGAVTRRSLGVLRNGVGDELVALLVGELVAVEGLVVALRDVGDAVVELVGVQQARQPLHAHDLVHGRRVVEPVVGGAGRLVVRAVVDGGDAVPCGVVGHGVVDAAVGEDDGVHSAICSRLVSEP